MKVFIKVFILSYLLYISMCISNYILNLDNDVISEYSSDGVLAKGALSYELASVGGNVLQNAKDYRSPQMVATGVIQNNNAYELPSPSPQESPDEVPSETDYYDGSKNLNVVSIRCNIYASSTDCSHQSNCGWCTALPDGASGCINGTNLGPLSPCRNGSFRYTVVTPNMMTTAQAVVGPEGGVSLAVSK
jgi:hypothetical protein